LRPVAYIPPVSSVDELVNTAKDLIDRGIRALHLAVNEPPAGYSPADPELDPFYALLAEKNIPLLTHLAAEQGYTQSFVWSEVPSAQLRKEDLDGSFSVHFFATLHQSFTNFLASMILGGVFERHPRLRYGVIEAGASWLGPFAEQMDVIVTKGFSQRLRTNLSLRPSEYLARNVRVTPFCKWEPVDEMFTRYPQIADCFVYSTDYPHVEGGPDSKQEMLHMVAPLGADVVDKFFVKNGQLLLPD